MDVSLSSIYESLTESLYIDLKGAKRPSEVQLQRFKDYFAIDADRLGLFYNDFNLIITDVQTFEHLQNFIKVSAVITKIESNEHNLFMAVYPYFNDMLVKQALE